MTKIIILAVVAAVIISGIFLFNRKGGNGNASPSPKATVSEASPTATPQTGLIIEDVVVGAGAEAKNGSVVTTHYLGTLVDGVKFDSSYDRGEPIKFTLGIGQVIQGWEQGILGMKVGGKRNLTIPPELAYGSQALGKIPPNSTLKFSVELLKVE